MHCLAIHSCSLFLLRGLCWGKTRTSLIKLYSESLPVEEGSSVSVCGNEHEEVKSVLAEGASILGVCGHDSYIYLPRPNYVVRK